jgi:hypothetical protein
MLAVIMPGLAAAVWLTPGAIIVTTGAILFILLLA